jgi:hypothetical protein
VALGGNDGDAARLDRDIGASGLPTTSVTTRAGIFTMRAWSSGTKIGSTAAAGAAAANVAKAAARKRSHREVPRAPARDADIEALRNATRTKLR